MNRFQIVGPDSADKVDLYDHDSWIQIAGRPLVPAMTREDRAELAGALVLTLSDRSHVRHIARVLFKGQRCFDFNESTEAGARKQAERYIEGGVNVAGNPREDYSIVTSTVTTISSPWKE